MRCRSGPPPSSTRCRGCGGGGPGRRWTAPRSRHGRCRTRSRCGSAGSPPRRFIRCGRLADGWLGAACTPEQAAAAKTTIDDAAASAGRQVDPEHFGLSIGYTHQPLDEGQLAALAARNRAADPRTLVPVGYPALRELLQSFIAVGMSKFVIRPPAATRPVDQAAWRDELSGLADAVADLQT